MKYAINLNSVLPLRKTAAETSEMVTQLLFGEFCEVFEAEGSFVNITNYADGYQGWADKKMLTEITGDVYLALQNQPVFRTCVPVAEVFSLTDKTIYRLSAGSRISNFNPDTNKFGVGEKVFQIHPSFVSYLPESSKAGIVPIALQFLNTPYLWGGKTVFGIDCSGFVQVVFSLNGISLPRDASQQAKEGEPVDFENAEAGDLLFFEKNGKIIHVGIYLGKGQIIHASGKVKINTVDNQGILSDEGLGYTHTLAGVRCPFPAHPEGEGV
ncbi:C40 family peptidase [Viscerimonas tarda]